MATNEAQRYENPELWDEKRYLGDPDELKRLDACVAAIPDTTTSVLDVGAGNGGFLARLEGARPELELHGLERSKAAIEHAVCKRTEIQLGCAQEMPFEDQSFDLVSALEVIEHLPFAVYEQALGEFERLARRHILLSVPYRENRIRITCPSCGCAFNPHYHMRSYDDDALNDLFRQFELRSSAKVIVEEVVLHALLGRVYRALARGGDFPSAGLCPQCGYKEDATPGRSPESTPACAPSRLGRLRGLLRRTLPRTRREKWAVALYERREG